MIARSVEYYQATLGLFSILLSSLLFSYQANDGSGCVEPDVVTVALPPLGECAT